MPMMQTKTTYELQNTSSNIHNAWHNITETGIYSTWIHGLPKYSFLWKPPETMLSQQLKVKNQFLVSLNAPERVKRQNSFFWY